MPLPFCKLKAFNLTRWFALVALASISVLALIFGLLLDRFFSERLMRQQARLTAEFVDSLMRVEQPMLDFIRQPGRGLDMHVEESLRHISAMPDVLRANVYGLDRVVLWSSDASLIGRRFQRTTNLDRALAGEVVAQHGDDLLEHGPPARRARLIAEGVFMETYVPVHDHTRGDRIVGAIEFYKTPSSLSTAIDELHTYIWVGAIAGAAFVYLAMFMLIRRADRTMRRQREQLLDQEKLAVIGEMSTAVAHGIRNPLASIRSSAELMQAGAAELAEQAASDVISECDRLEQWVNELLSYARPEHDEQAAIELPKLIHHCLDETRRELRRRHIEVETDWPEELPSVRGNALLLGQVLRSLLANAQEACASGGQIRVQARTAADRRQVLLSVIDNGPGMSAAQLSRVGQPFFTTKPRGLGVGLALARRVIERIGGRLEIHSSPGHGTSVHLCLPAH